MLAVQVSYWALQENKRHNLVTERQQDRNLNLVERDVNTRQFMAQETARHNQATEELGWSNLAETQRHNVANETIAIEGNKIAGYNAESNRMNAITNAAMIPIQQEQAHAATKQAEARERDANTNAINSASQTVRNSANIAQTEESLGIQQYGADTQRLGTEYRYQIDLGNLNLRESELNEKVRMDDHTINYDTAEQKRKNLELTEKTRHEVVQDLIGAIKSLTN